MTTSDDDFLRFVTEQPAALHQRMGIQITEATLDRVVGTMVVEGNTQPYGLLHGGANAVLVETAGSIGAGVHAGPGMMVVGLDINVTHHRSATAGTVMATAEPLSRGRTVTSYQVTVRDDEGRLLCTGRLTCLVRPAPQQQEANT